VAPASNFWRAPLTLYYDAAQLEFVHAERTITTISYKYEDQ
jgi:hypothetical protein